MLVQAGVHDDPVQPGGHSSLAAEGAGPPERRDHGVLKGVRGVVRPPGGAQGNRPQPVPVAGEQYAECVRVPSHMGLQEVGVGALVIHPLRTTMDRTPPR